MMLAGCSSSSLIPDFGGTPDVPAALQCPTCAPRACPVLVDYTDIPAPGLPPTLTSEDDFVLLQLWVEDVFHYIDQEARQAAAREKQIADHNASLE